MKKTDIEKVRRWLKGYRLNIKEIQARSEHIRWLKNDVYMPLIESGRGRDKYAAKKIEQIMADILRDASMRLAQLKYETEIIEKEINELDHYERCVLYNRYILGVPWIELPERIGYEIAQCQRIERKAVSRLAQLPRIQYFLNQNSPTLVDKPVDNLALGESTTIV